MIETPVAMPTRAPVPSPLPDSSSAIVALSEDEALLRALTVAMVEQAAIVTSPSVDRFIDQLASNRAEVALIDAAAAPTPIEGFMLRLHQQFPGLLIVLTGSAQLQTRLSTQIADGTIFRFAHKPASAQRLKLFVGAALRRGQEPRALPSADAQQGPASRVPMTALEASTRSKGLWPWVLIALALLGFSVMAWVRTGHSLPLRSYWPP